MATLLCLFMMVMPIHAVEGEEENPPVTQQPENGEESVIERTTNPVIINYSIDGSCKKGEKFNLTINIMDPGFDCTKLDMEQAPFNAYAAMNANSFASDSALGTIENVKAGTENTFLYYSVVFKNLVYTGDGTDKGFNFSYQFSMHQKGVENGRADVLADGQAIIIKEAYAPVAPVEKPKNAKLIVSSTNFGGSLKAGNDFTLNYRLKNVSADGAAKKVSVSVTSSNPKIAVSSTINTKYVGTIGKNSTSDALSFKFSIAKDITPGVETLTLNISYENEDGSMGQESVNVAAKVLQEDKVKINRAEIYEAFLGRETEIDYSIINSGLTTLANAQVKAVDEQGIELATAYVGNMEPAKEYSGNDLIFSFDETGSKTITFILEYETESGSKKQLKQDITVEVTEYNPPFIDPVLPMEPEKKGTPWYMWVVGLAVLGGAGFGGFKFYKKKKAKASVIDDEDF